MIRLELFVLLGIAIGIGITLAFQYMYRGLSALREARIVAKARSEALKVRIDEAETDELLEEISTRDDIARPSITWDPRMTGWKTRPLIEDEDGNLQAADSNSVWKQKK